MNRKDRRALGRTLADQIAKGGVDLSQVASQPADPAQIFLGYVAGENVRTAWHSSILALAARGRELGLTVRPRLAESGPQLHTARNMLAKSFLEDTEDQYLLFSDTDILFAPGDVKALLDAGSPIAGALYFTAALGMEPWPTALVEDESGGESLRPVALPEPPADLDVADAEAVQAYVAASLAPIPVAAVGCGLTLYTREVVQAVYESEDGFPFEYTRQDSEDITFCRRAAKLGYGTVLVPAARVGHLKVSVL